MFVYELALELDQKSGVLVDMGAEMGMADLMASSTLTAEQVHALRTAWYQRHGGVMPELPGQAEQVLPTVSKGALAGAMLSKVIVAVVLVGALGLFGYMATNTGDDARAKELAAKAAADDAKPAVTIAPIVTTSTLPGTPQHPSPTTPVADPTKATSGNSAIFCNGIRAAMSVQLTVGGSVVSNDWVQVRDAARRQQGAWAQAMADLRKGAPADLRSAVEAYANAYTPLFDAWAAAGSLSDVQEPHRRLDRPTALAAGRDLNGGRARLCS